MQIGHVAWMIAEALQDMLFFLEEILFPGAAKRNPQLFFLQLKRSTLKHHLLVVTREAI